VKAGERTFFADNLRYKKLICHKDLQQGKICIGEGYSKKVANPIIIGNMGIGLTFENCHRNGRVYHPNRENDRRCGQGPVFIPVLRPGCTGASRPANCKPHITECFWLGRSHSAVIPFSKASDTRSSGAIPKCAGSTLKFLLPFGTLVPQSKKE